MPTSPTIHHMESLIKSGESATVEFKRSLSDTRKIIETIAGMATIGGGQILVGVNSKGQVVGFNPGDGGKKGWFSASWQPPIQRSTWTSSAGKSVVSLCSKSGFRQGMALIWHTGALSIAAGPLPWQ